MSRLTKKAKDLGHYTSIDGSLEGYWECIQKLGGLEDLADEGRLIEGIRCKDCAEYDSDCFKEGFGWCMELERVTENHDYCSNAEAKLAELKEGVE